MCRRSSIRDYYFNIRGNNCAEFLTAIDEKIRSDDSSMITYYRHLIYLEKSCIYDTFLNDYCRRIITRWRLSNHKLKIETGRYSRPFVQRADRVCTICNILEDEYHVVFVCPVYQTLRIKYRRLLSANDDIKSILNPKKESIIETAQLLYEVEKVRKEMNFQK